VRADEHRDETYVKSDVCVLNGALFAADAGGKRDAKIAAREEGSLWKGCGLQGSSALSRPMTPAVLDPAGRLSGRLIGW
jgi:hypothetical protein